MPSTTHRSPRQQFEDMFRPRPEKVVILAGELYELDEQQPTRSQRLIPSEERACAG